MNHVKKFKLFENKNKNPWNQLGPNWLFYYILNEKGSSEVNGYIVLPHTSLDITVIFFIHNGEIRWTWTWGGAEGDLISLVKMSYEETLGFNITGDTPKEFVSNVMLKIDEIYKAYGVKNGKKFNI